VNNKKSLFLKAKMPNKLQNNLEKHQKIILFLKVDTL